MSALADRLRRRIDDDGPLAFAEFMEEALYGEGGYYAMQTSPVGVEGDFITGSTMSPLFGAATARLVRRLDRVLGASADVLEMGYGCGAHLRSLIDALDEDSGHRILAHDRIARQVPSGVRPVGDLDELKPGSLKGLIFSYELFDALPVNRLVGRADGSLGELCVDVGPSGSFQWVEQSLSDPSLAELLGEIGGLPPGQIADLSSEWRPLYRRLAERLAKGLLVTCDYGFERERLLDPRVRFFGTLASYRRHSVHRDALQAVGEQDLTAHVDFTALRNEGESAGLETVALTRQASWLLACGVFNGLGEADTATRVEAMTLLDPAGMGEEIRVLVQARGIDACDLFEAELLGI